MHGDWGASTRLAIQAGSCMITPRVCLLVESVSLPLHYRNTGTGLSQEYSVMGPTPAHHRNKQTNKPCRDRLWLPFEAHVRAMSSLPGLPSLHPSVGRKSFPNFLFLSKAWLKRESEGGSGLNSIYGVGGPQLGLPFRLALVSPTKFRPFGGKVSKGIQ